MELTSTLHAGGSLQQGNSPCSLNAGWQLHGMWGGEHLQASFVSESSFTCSMKWAREVGTACSLKHTQDANWTAAIGISWKWDFGQHHSQPPRDHQDACISKALPKCVRKGQQNAGEKREVRRQPSLLPPCSLESTEMGRWKSRLLILLLPRGVKPPFTACLADAQTVKNWGISWGELLLMCITLNWWIFHYWRERIWINNSGVRRGKELSLNHC